jgi:GT2 family glycosyltransferase
MRADVAVVIVSYHSLDDIRRCLTALDRSTWTQFRIVICENGGAEAFARLKEGLADRLGGGQAIEPLQAPDNLGYAGGINYCIEHSRPADAYWILNPDTEPEPDALEALMARLARGDCTAVGHDLVLESGRLASLSGEWRAWSARPISIDHGKPRPASIDPQRIEARMNYIVGASMLISRGFVDRVGLLRDDYFLYCEEVEWCLRAGKLGERLGYTPDAVVLHAHGTTTGGGGGLSTRSRAAVYLTERNRILVTHDVYPGRLAIVAPLCLAHMLLKYGKAGAWRQALYAAQGWLAGMRNERGKPAWFEDRGGASSGRAEPRAAISIASSEPQTS